MQVNGTPLNFNTPVYHNGIQVQQVVAKKPEHSSYYPQYAWIPFTTMPGEDQSFTYTGDPTNMYNNWLWSGDINGNFQNTPAAHFNCENWNGDQTFTDDKGMSWSINGSYTKTSRGTLKLTGGSLQLNSFPNGGHSSDHARYVKIVLKPDWSAAGRYIGSYGKFYTIYSTHGANRNWYPYRYSGKDILIGEGNSSGNYNSGYWYYRINRRASKISEPALYKWAWGHWWYSTSHAIGKGNRSIDQTAAGQHESFVTVLVRDSNHSDGGASGNAEVLFKTHYTGTTDTAGWYNVGGLDHTSSDATYQMQDNITLVVGGSFLSNNSSSTLYEFHGEIAQVEVWTNESKSRGLPSIGYYGVSDAHGRYAQCRLHEERVASNYWNCPD